MKNIRKLYGNNLERIVPVKVFPDISSMNFDGEVKKKLNLLREESVEFKKLSESKGESDGSVVDKFKMLAGRMIKIIEREGCYYPESIRNEVVSIAMGSGGPIFSSLFVSNNVSESLKRIPMNCKAL